jgi:hypothetical protein
VLARKNSNQRIFDVAVALALACCLFSLLYFFVDPAEGWVTPVFRAVFFAIIAFAMMDLATEREVRVQSASGTIEFLTKKPLAAQTSKKYLIARLEKVEFHQPLAQAVRGPRSTWMRFQFKDGTRIVSFVRSDYVPTAKDFPGVKIEYIY